MKKTFFMLLLAACVVSPIQAQRIADMQKATFSSRHRVKAVMSQGSQRVEGLSSIQRPVGYIVNNNPDSITTRGVMIGQEGTFPVAVAITEDMLTGLIGCKVVGIRVAASQSLGKSDVFLYPLVNNSVTDEGITKSQRLYEGWNNVFFNGDTSWEIKEGEGLIVGFNYTETAEMVAAEQGALCTVGESQGNDFLVYGNFGSGTGWYGINNVGSLCVQLIVDVSSLPERALSLAYLDTGFRYKQRGENIEMYVIAQNTGRRNISGFTIACQLDDQAPQLFQYDEAVPEGGNSHQQPTVALGGDVATGVHHLKVSLLAEEDTEPQGNGATQEVTFFVYEQSVAKQQNYVEMYNSQIEYQASVLNPVFNNQANSGNMALVNVYSPGNQLSMGETDYLFDLYAYTVPSFTINRSYFPGEAYIAYDLNDYLGYSSLLPGLVGDLVAQDLLMPAFATINLEPTYDEGTRTLTVNVTGDLVPEAIDIFGTPALTLLLTENNVKGTQTVVNNTTGRVSTQSSYPHQHVFRRFITPALGTPVTVSGQQFTAQCSTVLDASWKLKDLILVGFITRGAEAVTDDNVMLMDITNCNSISLDGVTGITELQGSATASPAEYFTIDGRRVDVPTVPGLYLVREGSITRKVMVR